MLDNKQRLEATDAKAVAFLICKHKVSWDLQGKSLACIYAGKATPMTR